MDVLAEGEALDQRASRGFRARGSRPHSRPRRSRGQGHGMAWFAPEQAVTAHRGEARMQVHPGPSPSALETVIVVEERGDFRWGESGAHIVTADEYLRESATVPQRRVINLCREHTHLSAGYYVSLVAAARREEALPDVAAIVDMEHAVFREKAGVGLERLLATAPKSSFVSAALSLHIYFGQTAHV